MISLIANSGIQLLVRDVEFDLNSGYKKLFYESFDTANLQWRLEYGRKLKGSETVVLNSELREKGYVDNEGNLIASDNVILANPHVTKLDIAQGLPAGLFYSKLSENNRNLDSFFNVWLPLPYLEVDSEGSFKDGPYNWSRCKIIPGEKENGKLKAQLVLVFDTRTIYDDYDEYREGPSFINEGDTEKHYALCRDELKLIDYCVWNNSWVRDTIMKLVYPDVTDFNALLLPDGSNKYSFLTTYLTLVDYLGNNADVPDVRFMRDRNVKHVPVEMIVDIGNSRTSAILFEEQDFTKVDTLKLQDFTHMVAPDGTLNRKDDTFDMRLAFRKVDFGPNIMGSNQFVWPSMVRLGREAQYLTHATTALAIGEETMSTYSSPKRYLWDSHAVEQEWRFTSLNENERPELPEIGGVSNFLNDDGSLAEDGFGIGAHYCRQSLMTLAFMEIVQQAQVQINSYDTRKHNGKILTPRVIEKIILTCPTAMSLLEQKALYQSLRDAVFVLNQFNLVNDATAHEAEIEVIPDVKVDEDGNRSWFYDEATCSQLVYLYGQFCERYRNCSDKFFELYGKKREVKGVLRDTIKIGSVDIGAGTTDVSVCQYEYNNANPSQIKPIPVFWDSFNTAGDDMLRVLISNVIIEGDNAILYKHMREKGWGKREIYSKLHHFFGKDSSMMSFADRMMRRDFNLQVNVPVMYRFLQLLSDEVHYGEFTFGEMFGDNLPNEQVMKAFADNFGFNLEEVVWTYDSQLLSKYVERSMDRLIESISTVLYAFDCDIVLLSGRPTNLAPIKRCFLKHFPVSPNRLVVMGRYRVGLWYPFRDESGFMRDTKSVVPVGAMIGYLASRAGGLNEFTLDLNQLGAGLKPTTDYFLKLNRITQEPCIITPEKSTGNVRANSFPLYIATKQYDLSMYPERPFYVIDINKEGIEQRLQIDGELDKHALQIEYTKYKEKLLGRSPFLFTLEREDMSENKENLEISTVVDREGEDVNINDFSLTVQSLNDPECYWLDSGEFELGIATKDLKTNNNA